MPPIKDISGQRFGKLVAIEFAYRNNYEERVYHCKCDCGNDAYVSRHSLVAGNTKSCGCLSRYERKKKVRINNCVCEQCGREFYLTGYKLKRSKRHFCGYKCYSAYLKEHPEETPAYKNRDDVAKFFASKVIRLRTSARKRKIQFSEDLTTEYLVELWNKQGGKCFYSGIPLSFDPKDTVCLVSVDRIDNSKGYEPGNIVLCCYALNVFKFSYPKEELDRLISLIRQYG